MGMTLPDNITECHEVIRSLDEEVTELRQANAWLMRQLFGQKADRRAQETSSDQLDLFGEQPEATEEEVREERKEPPRDRRRGKLPLPKNLRREEIVIDVPAEQKTCECGQEKVRIGEDVTERLDVIPARLYARRYIRPKYACPCCRNGVAQAPQPGGPLGRSAVEPGLLAYLIVSKYADHLPLCRMERIFARHGIDLPRARMSDWLLDAADLLVPLYRRMRDLIRGSTVLGADETRLDMRTNDKNKGKHDQCWLWVCRGDDAAPYTVFDFHPTRGADAARAMLGDFGGFLQSDDYTVYPSLRAEVVKEGRTAWTEVRCWAHARRKFVEAEKAGDARVGEAINLIGALYAVEKEAAAEPGKRLELRREKAIPILGQLRDWLNARLTVLPKTPLGQAISYALDNWDALSIYTTDPRLPIDNNAVERAIRPVAIGRRNWLFAGSERGGNAAATWFTLIDSARRAGLNPYEYLRDLLTRIGEHPINRIDDLLPDRWQPAAN